MSNYDHLRDAIAQAIENCDFQGAAELAENLEELERLEKEAENDKE
jgi:excinuclease UvrABC nuclease subunit